MPTFSQTKPITIPLLDRLDRSDRPKVKNLILKNIIITNEIHNIFVRSSNQEQQETDNYPANPDPNCLYCELDLDHNLCSPK